MSSFVVTDPFITSSVCACDSFPPFHGLKEMEKTKKCLKKLRFFLKKDSGLVALLG